MAKKKRRRLKKSVRRGCAIILALPILFALGYYFTRFSRLSRYSSLSSPSSLSSSSADTAYLADLAQRIDGLLCQPLRLDTTTIALEVYDVQTGITVCSRNAHRLVPPASCMKLLTATAAMQFLGTGYSFESRIVARGQQSGETFHGDMLFLLSDDPLLESLEPMVDAIRQQGIRRIEGKVLLHLMRDEALRAHPTAATWDIPYNRLPILLKERARVANDLHYLMQTRGIDAPVPCAPSDTDCVALPPFVKEQPGDILLYHHRTPLVDVLAPMLIHSSNIKADGLFLHLGQMCSRLPGIDLTPSGWLLCQAALADDLQPRQWPSFVVNDGSGLSPDNRLTTHFLVALLRYAWEREDMRRVLIDEALATPAHPVRRGSLLGRMSAPEFRNRVFVKTGTLTTRALSSLAGYAQTSDGRWLIFAVVNEDSPVMESRIFQDRLCRELVR